MNVPKSTKLDKLKKMEKKLTQEIGGLENEHWLLQAKISYKKYLLISCQINIESAIKQEPV